MKNWYKVFENRIEIYNTTSFNPKHIFECGQVFAYKKTGEDCYEIYVGDFCASVHKTNFGYEILCENPTYFEEYFDLKTDYETIKKQLSSDFLLSKIIPFGSGIRLLHQPTEEVILSFLISANNNIKRIQRTIFALKSHCGKPENGYFSFPTAKTLAKLNEEFFNKIGMGYRSKYFKDTSKFLSENDLSNLQNLKTEEARKILISLAGVGPKVADCILLFGLGKRDVFPCDTWIEKVYNDNYFCGKKNRKQISDFFVSKFGELAGYAQQYLFYAKREGKIE